MSQHQGFAGQNDPGAARRDGVPVAVPADPVPLLELLPVIRILTDQIVDRAAEAAESRGRKVSCQKGCGACCRQLVPISEVEAHAIASLVQNLPEPRRTEVTSRFTEVRERLENAGIARRLLERESLPDSEVHANDLGLDYLRLGVACPFLEDESCSIHDQRPVACREYLVTSPAENCLHPDTAGVQLVRLPVRVSSALTQDDSDPPRRFGRWVPLSLAPDWAATHPPDRTLRPGPEWLELIGQRVTGRQVTPPPK